MPFIHRILSGGQTGADRAALDFAIEMGLPYGGWVPKGRLDELGRIPDRYAHLIEADSEEWSVRTRRNVLAADGTVILSHGPLAGGSTLTLDCATSAEPVPRPCLHLDLARQSIASAAESLRRWLTTYRIQTLNIAGPRASEDPAIYDDTLAVLRAAFAE